MVHDAAKARRPRAGWWTVHWPAVLLARVPGFHQCDCGEVAAPRSILWGRVCKHRGRGARPSIMSGCTSHSGHWWF